MRIDRKQAQTTIFGWRSSKAPLGFRDNPSHSQWISLRVTFRSSSGVSGQVPLEDLDQCASAIAECEHTAGVRVEMEFQFDDRG